MQTRALRTGGFDLLVSGLLAACLLTLCGCTSDRAIAKKEKATHVVPVKTVAVETTQVQRSTLQPATVHAFYRAEIRAKASGFVKNLQADIGDYVEAGAKLAEIDVPEMLMQRQVIDKRIERLIAEEQRGQAGVRLAEARVRSAQALLAEASSQMAGAEASLAASQAEFDRTEDLVERGSLQNRMLDESRMKRDSEAARRDAMASSIESAKAEVAVAEAQVVAAQAASDAAQAETEIERSQRQEMDALLDYATLRAPFAGVVTQRNLEPGDLVRQSNEVGRGQPLFVISQVDRVRVRIAVPEAEAALVNPGDEVTLTFPSFSAAQPIVAAVTRTSGSLDPSTRTMLVEVELDNQDGKLLPGMFGQASIHLDSKVAAQTLPSRAIRFDEEGNGYVYVVGEDETIARADITTGLDDGNSIEVLSGIEPGQRVVGPHLKRFSDGQKVAVLPN
ncbi:Multidrug resistance protein MdtA precursor [Allorhodopirellula solitaria]|uniref:Multidrug resistance protein MdtA n=2 Tax=Allorhodopirellula solitaria TaxID=2527987 RepID=A0A5C5Y0M2_9BACT|nr:Multidrug resistance protein MdtA precursor [Allorhodopirellula solitaria]